MQNQYVAFMRAINLGKRTVKREQFIEIFSSLGFTKVEPFLASGNVIFQTDQLASAELETLISNELEQALGFEVACFLRDLPQLEEIAARNPFSPHQVEHSITFCVALMKRELDEAAREAVDRLRTDEEFFQPVGRELHWISKVRASETKITIKMLEKAVGGPLTIRGVNTIRRLCEKLR
ncbi:MAG: DUF1697 domain-containing protein [Chthonomonadales bacterium]